MASGYLGPQHPLAAVVARLCREHLGRVSGRLVGGVGCGACWEQAIRDDERAVVLSGLPRELEPDPTLIDEIAVELACWGEPTSLTRAERAEVVRRLTARGEPASRIAERLRTAARSVTRTPGGRAARRGRGAGPGWGGGRVMTRWQRITLWVLAVTLAVNVTHLLWEVL